MLLQGRTMLSEQECLRKVRKPLMGKGKKANKVVVDKNGNEVWVTVKEFDPAKSDKFNIDLKDKEGNEVPTTIYTRGSRPATKTININNQAYEYFISREVPLAFTAPKNFKPNFKVRKSANEQAWLLMSEAQRLRWHLDSICTSMGGKLMSYNVLED